MAQQIPREFINDLLNRVDVVSVIESHIALKKAGNNRVACCPFHDEKTPSFSVSPTKQFYYCFGCGASGNSISFLMAYQRLNFVEAVESLAQLAGVSVPRQASQTNAQRQTNFQDYYQLLEQVANYYHSQLRKQPDALAYLKQRGLTGDIIKAYQIGFAPAGWDNLLKQFNNNPTCRQQLSSMGLLVKKDSGGSYDRFRRRIMFPIRDPRNRVVGFGGRVIDSNDTPKYLNSPETPVFHKGRELYGLYHALQANRQLDHVLIVEGYMDVVALAQHGVNNAVATLGTATSKEHIRQLMRHTDKIYFCFDGDEAGKKAAWRALEVILPILQDGLQVRFIFLPQGHDPDSLVREQGKQGLATYIEQAIALPDFMFKHIQAQVDLGSMDGKAQFVKQASELINKMPQGALHHMMLEKLAKIVRIQPDQLSNLLDKQPALKVKPASNTSRRRAPSNMRLIVALLLQNPQLAQYIDDAAALKKLKLPGSQFLKELVDILQQQPNLATGALLEYWRGHDNFDRFSQLASWEHCVPADGIVVEFQAALKRLFQQGQAQQVEYLLNKANQQELTDSEKRLLQQLIMATKLEKV